MADFSTLLIVGAGQMGEIIAKTLLHSGYHVLIYDIETSRAIQCKRAITASLSEEKSGFRTTTSSDAIVNRLEIVNSLQESVRSDVILETATENLAIKTQIFSSLSHYITEDTVLATNTSSLSISDIAMATDCPERVIGMHFINPLPTMPLIEIVRGHKTSNETVEIAIKLALSLGKEPIEVNDYPGFISNRLVMPLINEAITCLFDGVADADAIDRIMQLGLQHPMGPLQLADLIGLDTCLSILEILYRDKEDVKYRPCPLLRTMVKSGKLGKKTLEGFYKYDAAAN